MLLILYSAWFDNMTNTCDIQENRAHFFVNGHWERTYQCLQRLSSMLIRPRHDRSAQTCFVVRSWPHQMVSMKHIPGTCVPALFLRDSVGQSVHDTVHTEQYPAVRTVHEIRVWCSHTSAGESMHPPNCSAYQRRACRSVRPPPALWRVCKSIDIR